MAALARDPVIRIDFWLDIYLGGIKLGDIQEQEREVTPKEAELVRLANAAIEGVKTLVASAASGSHAAEEMLCAIADRALQAENQKGISLCNQFYC